MTSTLDNFAPTQARSPLAPEPWQVEIGRAQETQKKWAAAPLAQRLGVLKRFRHLLAQGPAPFIAALSHLPRTGAETLTSELLPLAEACRFLEQHAPKILKPRTIGRGPFWLGNTRATISRQPLGLILILAPSNYPLFLPGVQLLQALAAGNAVLLKPAPTGARAARALATALADAGLPPYLLTVLPEETAFTEKLLDTAPLAKVFLTGSFATAQKILPRLAPRAIPAVLELSGNDPAILLAHPLSTKRGATGLETHNRGPHSPHTPAATRRPGSQVPTPDPCLPGGPQHLASLHPHFPRFLACLRFGILLNHGQTCIAPRRAFVPRTLLPSIEKSLAAALDGAPAHALPAPIHQRLLALIADARQKGASLLTPLPPSPESVPPQLLSHVTPAMQITHEDLFAPHLSLMPYDSESDLLDQLACSPYALGASIFGDEQAALALSRKLPAGTITLNDLIAPTADPRLPFAPAPSSRSGHGTTRGPEGLLEMTSPRTTIARRGNFLPHLTPPSENDPALFTALLRARHAPTLTTRLSNLYQFLKSAIHSKKSPPN